MSASDILAEIKTATGWSRIHLINQTYVVKFADSDRSAIKGLCRDDQTFFLDFSDFEQVPISFLTDWNGITIQYWTLNRRLHRVDQSKPAKISYHWPSYQDSASTVYREYFYNGLRHRVGGPAITSYTGYSVDQINPASGEEVLPDHYVERWTEFSGEWFRDGQAQSYPNPGKLVSGPGYRICQTRDGQPDSDPETVTTFYDSLAINYTDYSGENRWLDRFGNFYISHILMNGLREYYREGKYAGRFAEYIGLQVKRPNRSVDSDVINQNFQDVYLNRINLWDGPLFQDSQDELAALADISTVLQDNL